MSWYKDLLGKWSAEAEDPRLVEQLDQAPEPPAPPGLEWWWAVSHRGHHPAFYLRALLPGDFAPGHLPLARHARAIEGSSVAPPGCSTCGELPESPDLEVVERLTGARAFLEPFRSGRAKWPAPTDPATCWECCSKTRPASYDVAGVKVCGACVETISRRGV